MALLDTKESKKDVSVRTAQLVQLLTEIGPDIPEISRRLGQFKESVRYRYKEKILNRGFVVQATADQEGLGLKRMIVLADFTDEFRPYAATILTAMSKLCFVVSFEKTLPHGEYIVHASVAREHTASFAQFIGSMKTMGILSSAEIFDFDWHKNAPMKAEFYDFDSGRWDFDWSQPSLRDFNAGNTMPSERTKFDPVDLLLISEFQSDANKSLKEIAAKLDINYKKLAWHYQTHVLARNLINGYRINWMGTRYDEKAEKALQRQHRYFISVLMVRGVTPLEMMTLRQKLSQLPFLWSEAVGRDYFSEFAFPVDYVTEAYQYLEEAISSVRYKAELLAVDQTNALAFTIPYEMYDSASKRWVFNPQEATARFENLVLKIRESGSSRAS